MRRRPNRAANIALPYLVIIVAAIVIVAAVAMALSGVLGGGGESKMTATIFIEGDDGSLWSADVDLGDPTFGEQAMLSISQDIRKAEFKPVGSGMDYLATPQKLWFTGTEYAIYAVVTVNIESDNLASVDYVEGKFYGYAGERELLKMNPPSHATSTNALKAVGVDIPVTVRVTDDVENNPVTIDQSKGGRFRMVSTSTGVGGSALNGNVVDGAKFIVEITVSGTQPNGATISATAFAQMKIEVQEWDSSSISVSVTGMSGGGF